MRGNSKRLYIKRHPYWIFVFMLPFTVIIVMLFIIHSIKQFSQDKLISEIKSVANNICIHTHESLLFDNFAQIQVFVIDSDHIFLNKLDYIYIVYPNNKIYLSNYENKIGEIFQNDHFVDLIFEKEIKVIQNRHFYFKIYATHENRFYSLSISPVMGQLDYYSNGKHKASIYFSLTTSDASKNFIEIFYALIIGTLAIIILLSIIVKMLSDYYIGPFSLFLNKLMELSSGIIDPINIGNIKGPLRRFVTHFNEVTYSLVKAQQKEKELEVQKGIVRATQVLAHDVRKPFSMMQLILDSLDRLQSDSAELNFAKCEVEKSIKNVESMIYDIMDYSREVELSTEPSSLYRILDYVVRQTIQAYPENKISIDYQLSAKNMPLVDEERIARVFINIISNAIEAITTADKHKKGTITITSKDVLYDNRSTIEIVIGNDGPPFKDGIVDKLFESFFTHGKKKGTGLGMASAQKIVHLHKGTITARNRVDGNGVEFVIRIMSSNMPETSRPISLPTHIDTNYYLLQNSNIDHSIRRIGQQKEIYRIILLEDEVLYRAGIKNLINEKPYLSENIILYDATTVDEALELVKNAGVKHAIVDIDLNHDQNGYDFLTIVKEKYPDLVCLVHSNRVTKEDKQKAFDLGATYFAPKPMNLAHLVNFISGTPVNEVLPGENPVKEKDIVKKTDVKTKSADEDKTSVNVLIIDDEMIILDMLSTSVEKRFRDNRKPVHVLTANTYRNALDLLNEHCDKLNYVLCDLNIDESRDGLLLAEAVHELNKNREQKIDFYILTHSNVDRFNKTVCQSRVKQFFQHPLPLSTLGIIFQNEFDLDEEKQVSNDGCASTTNADTIEKSIAHRAEASVSEVENYLLLQLINAANKKILKKICHIIGHNAVGELDIIKYDIVNSMDGEQETIEFVKNLPYRLCGISEELRSFLDIVKYNEKAQIKNMFIVPFELKFFVDRFIKKQLADFEYQLDGINIVNNISDKSIKIMGDEALFEKVVFKVFFNVLTSYINHENEGDIAFSTITDVKSQMLQMTCDTINDDIGEDFINNLFYNTPFSSSYFNLDYAVCGYLMSLHNGHISVKIDQTQKTTFYCFSFDKETCN